MEIDYLKNLTQPVFYVTNDVSRGIGLENLLPNYHIICLDDHPLVDILKKEGVSVFCLERILGEKNLLRRTSGTILAHPAVLSFIKEKSGNQRPNLLFFKPQKRIEMLAEKNNFYLLGNSVEINRQFEDKVAFFELCRREGIKVPAGEIAELAILNYQELAAKYGEKLVVQFGRGWAGNSTFFIENEEELKNLQDSFGRLLVRISRFVAGRTILNNAVVLEDRVLVSPPALQIRAEKSLTSTQGGTGGRRWPVELTLTQEKEIQTVTEEVGEIMKKAGYRGFFGLDFLIDEESREVFLSENNARLTASVPFFTKLELAAGAFPLLGYHLLAFLPEVKVGDWTGTAPELRGGEIIGRNTEKSRLRILGSLRTGLYNEKFEFKRETSFLETDNPTDFWLQTATEGRIVNPEIELLKIDTLGEICDSEGFLNEKYRQIVSRVKEALKPQKC